MPTLIAKIHAGKRESTAGYSRCAGSIIAADAAALAKTRGQIGELAATQPAALATAHDLDVPVSACCVTWSGAPRLDASGSLRQRYYAIFAYAAPTPAQPTAHCRGQIGARDLPSLRAVWSKLRVLAEHAPDVVAASHDMPREPVACEVVTRGRCRRRPDGMLCQKYHLHFTYEGPR